jgi:4'-phosphopantetheinyl transferase
MIEADDLPGVAATHSRLARGEVLVWTARSTAGTADGLADVLSAAETRDAARFATEALRRRYAVAHGLLRTALARSTDVEPRDVPLTRRPCLRCGGPHGKPELDAAARLPDVRFNLSYTDDLACVALCLSREVGVDVERRAEGRDVLGFADAVLTREEHATFAALPADARSRAFYDVWARKEAMVKATGEGLVARELATVAVPLEPRVRCEVTMPGAGGSWWLCDLDIADDYSGAVAVAGRDSVRMSTWHLG